MCPVTCGEGALQKRSVMCVSASRGEDQPELALPDHDCDESARPEEVEPCPELPLCEAVSTETPVIVIASDEKNTAFYNVSEATDSTTLDSTEILEFDNVVDVDGPSDGLDYNSKPKWRVSKWSQCINGKRTRKVSCSIANESGTCGIESKPSDSEECKSGKWVTGKYYYLYSVALEFFMKNSTEFFIFSCKESI